MAWELRNGAGPYYTRSRRVRGQVVREYFGQGPLAEAIALQDAAERADHRARQDALQAENRAELALRASVQSFTGQVTQLMFEALQEVGHHYHRGQWRRRRQMSET